MGGKLYGLCGVDPQYRSVVDKLIRTEIVSACGRWEHVKALRHERDQCLKD